MARTIVITSKHQLGTAGVKARVTDRFAALKTSYVDKIGAADLTWDGDVGHAWATALGQKGKATLTASETDLHIEIELPWLLAGMGGMVESIVRGNADALHPQTPTSSSAVAA